MFLLGRHAGRANRLLAWVVACNLPLAGAAAQILDQDAPETWSRFQRTALFLEQSPPDEQADFATKALTQLIEVYLAEADLARAEGTAAEGSVRARLLGWSQAVDQYANQLLLLLEDIDEGYPVTVLQSREGSVTVLVAGRAVMLGHPRADQQAAYEQRVLAEFCARRDCQRMTAVADKPRPIPVSTSRVKPRWVFTEQGPLCEHGGIEVRFSGTDNLAFARSTCGEFLQEAAALAAEIAWQVRHGVAVDWPELTISPTPGKPEHLVRLNAAGDSLLLTLPLLFGSPGLLEDLTPWLRDRWSGAESVRLHLKAADYGWEPAGDRDMRTR